MTVYAAESDLDAGWDTDTVNLVASDPGATVRNEARIASALVGASAVIDSYLGQRYPLPVAPSSSGAALLAACCADLAIARLADKPGALTEIMKERRDTAIAWLREVAASRAALPLAPDPAAGSGAPGSPGGPITPGEAVVIADPRLFTRRSLREL